MKYHLIDLERTESTGIVFYWKQNLHGYTPDKKEAGRFGEFFAFDKMKTDADKHTAVIPAE